MLLISSVSIPESAPIADRDTKLIYCAIFLGFGKNYFGFFDILRRPPMRAVKVMRR